MFRFYVSVVEKPISPLVDNHFQGLFVFAEVVQKLIREKCSHVVYKKNLCMSHYYNISPMLSEKENHTANQDLFSFTKY